ncbi:MAG TPA: site-2 protease family protein [Candidatus Angelobacter sp.]
MSTSTANLNRICKRCSGELPPGALDCPQCHALVHEEQLERTAARARAFEANGSLWDAREQWQQALQLLPQASKQAEWIRSHIRELETTIHAPGAPDTRKRWAKWLAPLAPIAVLLAKFKTLFLLLFKLKFLLSFGAFIVIYWQLYGAWFGIGFAVMILIHEMGHFIDVKRRGLPAEMPVFLPGLGAYVKWQAMGVSLETRAAVSLAGPLAGWFAAGVAGLVYFYTGNMVWAALARAGAWLNILNLAPVWILDGGQAVLAINKLGRAAILAVSIALALVLEEWVLLLVAAGLVYRLFTRDDPEEGSSNLTLYYAAVLAGLAFVMRLMPGAGFGR